MIDTVKGYIRSRMHKLGYREHTNALNDTDIPETALNKTFFIHLKDMTKAKANQRHIEASYPFELMIYHKPVRDPRVAVDESLVKAEAVISDFIAHKNRSAYSANLKNVSFDSMAVEPLAGSDDNGVRVVIRFQALVVMSTAA